MRGGSGETNWKRARPAILALALPALAGCSMVSSPPPPPCPAPGIVDGMNTKQQATGSATTTVAWRAAMLGFRGGCGYDGEGARVSLQVDLGVTPGPAFGSQTRKITLPYFVAVADPTGTVIDKQVFTATLDVPPSTGTVVVTERLEQRLAGVDAVVAPQWRIYLGLELTREEALQGRSPRP